MTRTIIVDHLARVEGHGGITVVLGRQGQSRRSSSTSSRASACSKASCAAGTIADVPAIVSRICAICSHGHTITSLQALEERAGVAVTPQTRQLRDLAYQGANIESHALHVFCLALPDFLGHPSVISLAGANPDAVALALRLKKLGNTIQEVDRRAGRPPGQLRDRRVRQAAVDR